MFTEKFSRQYGDSRLIGNQDNFFQLSIEDQARAQGWSDACPVVERLIKPVKEGGRGPLEMRNLYGKINFWSRYILDELIKAGKIDTASEITRPQKRSNNEPVGIHDENWPPEELLTYTFRSSVAYAIPRVLIDFLQNLESDKTHSFVVTLDLLDQSIAESENAVELAVLFTEKTVLQILELGNREKAGLLFRYLLSSGKLKEDNSHHQAHQIITTIREKTPKLWSFYQSLTLEEKQQWRIIDQATLAK